LRQAVILWVIIYGVLTHGVPGGRLVSFAVRMLVSVLPPPKSISPLQA